MLDTIPTNIRPSKNGNVRCHNLTFRRGHSIYCYILQFNRTLVMSTLLTLPVPVTTTPEQQQQQQNKSTHPNATCKDNTADTRATVLSNISSTQQESSFGSGPSYPRTSRPQNTTETTDSLNKYATLSAIFIVKFDVYRGNILEWQYPETIDLSGIEYQAICSGLHRVDSDLIFFSRSGHYGLSAFRKVPIEGDRGASMQAIGVLVTSERKDLNCGYVSYHGDFLQERVNEWMKGGLNPVSLNSSLKEYYTLYCASTDPSPPQPHHHSDIYHGMRYPITERTRQDFSLTASLHHTMQQYADTFSVSTTPCSSNAEDTLHLAHDFSALAQQFGPSLFILWKAALLRKRILFITDPPMQHACQLVYQTFLMSHVPCMSLTLQPQALLPPVPRFTIGVNDIESLENTTDSYIACTSDTIFKSKPNLYDVLITLPTPSFHPPSHHDSAGLDSNIDHPLPKGEAGQGCGFALGNLNSPPTVHIIGGFMPSHCSPADKTRFRILWQMLQTIGESRGMTPTSIEKTLESLPSQCMPSQWEEILWRGWLWWYNTPSTCRNTTNTRASSWQMLFGGINPSNPRHQHHRKRYPVPMDAAEQQALLLGEDTTDLMDDEQDATVLPKHTIHCDKRPC